MKQQRCKRSNSRRRGICLSGIAVLVAIAGSIAEGTQSGLDDGGLGDSASASGSQPKVACSKEMLLRGIDVPEGFSEAGWCSSATAFIRIQGGAGARARRIAFEMARLRAAKNIVSHQRLAESINAKDWVGFKSGSGRSAHRVHSSLAAGQIRVLDACVRWSPNGSIRCEVVGFFPASGACDASQYGRPLELGQLRQCDEGILVEMLGVRNGVDEAGLPILIAFGQTDPADEEAGESPAIRAKAVAASQLFARCMASELRASMEYTGHVGLRELAEQTPSKISGGMKAKNGGEGSGDGEPASCRILAAEASWDGVRVDEIEIVAGDTKADYVVIENVTTRLDWQWDVERGAAAALSSAGVVKEGWDRGVELLRLLEEGGFIRTVRQWSCKDPVTGQELHGAIMAITKADLKQIDLLLGLRSDEASE